METVTDFESQTQLKFSLSLIRTDSLRQIISPPTVSDFIFLGSKITADGDCSGEIKKTLTPWKDSYDQLSILKNRDIANKGPSSQSYGFSSSHVWM